MIKRIVVWFSCGAASAVAAKLTLDQYRDKLPYVVDIVNSPVVEEDEDNRRFLRDVTQWLGVEIISTSHPDYPLCSASEVWERRKFMSAPHGAPCTFHLKKQPRQFYERSNPVDWHVLGFTAEEKHRHDRFVLSERDNVLPVLIDAGLTKQDCIDIIQQAGVKLPRVYAMGYPNANCIGCVKATSPTYWNHVRQQHPEIFKHRAKQSRKLGARLVRVRGERIFLDELDPAVKGRPLQSMNVECGVFCEEGVDGQ